MPLSSSSRRFLEIVADAPPLDTQSAGQNRADLENARELIGEAAPMHAVVDADVSGVPVRVFRPTAEEHGAAVVYLHGGGWVLGGGLRLFDTACRDIARHSGALEAREFIGRRLRDAPA